MFQTHILQKKLKEENRQTDKPRSKTEGKSNSLEKVEKAEDNLDIDIDTTVLSINESFTEPLIIEAVVDDQTEERRPEDSSCQIETNVEVHNKTQSRPEGKSKERKYKTVRGKSAGALFEDEEKVCLAATATGGSKKKTFSRPEVQLSPPLQRLIKSFADKENILLPETWTARYQGLWPNADQCRPLNISDQHGRSPV